MVKVHAIFGGKNPHPNYLVGGINMFHQAGRRERHQRRAPGGYVSKLFEQGKRFVEQVYIPDLLVSPLSQRLGRHRRRLGNLPGLRRPAHQRLQRPVRLSFLPAPS